MIVSVIDIGVLTRNWWAFALRGAVAVVFGLLTLLAPGLSLAALVLAFGAYAFVDGVFSLVSVIRARTEDRPWWLLILHGVAGIAAGVGTVFYPGITALVLLYLIAAWALVTGIFQVVSAIRLRKSIKGEWLLALGGILSIALGVVLVLFPGPGALAVVLWIGAYALILGALHIALGVRLRTLRARTAEQTGPEVPQEPPSEPSHAHGH
jgi:uncharacterized membrane protein HdeD (DUF308 family)